MFPNVIYPKLYNKLFFLTFIPPSHLKQYSICTNLDFSGTFMKFPETSRVSSQVIPGTSGL